MAVTPADLDLGRSLLVDRHSFLDPTHVCRSIAPSRRQNDSADFESSVLELLAIALDLELDSGVRERFEITLPLKVDDC
jgi:hypothetical protein